MSQSSSQPSSDEPSCLTSANPLHPLILDPETNEPYLALPAPYDHIIITPSRATDVPVLLRVLNDLRVARYLVSSPFPFTRDHAESFISRRRSESAALIQSMRNLWAAGVPVHSVRDMRGTSFAEATLIGHVAIKRHDFDEVLDETEMLRLDAENAAKPEGDPSIVWTIGDWLDPAYHGQGIMTAVIRTLIHDWMVPRLNAHIVRVSMWTGHAASVRVFEKMGFQRLPDVPDWGSIAESKGGGRTGLHVMEWQQSAT